MSLRSVPETPVSVSQARPAPPMAEVRRLLNRYRRDALRTRKDAPSDASARERDRRV